MSVTSSSDTIRVEVCYLPPFEWNPTLPRARELLSTIKDPSSPSVLYTFQPARGCYTAPSAPNTCIAVQIASSTLCTDAQLFVETERLEIELYQVLGLSTTDNGVLWSQISSGINSILSSLSIAIQMGDNPNAKATLMDSISERGSTILSLINSIFPSNYGSIAPYTTDLTQWRSIMAVEATQILEDVTTSAAQLSLDSAASSYDDQWRKMIVYIPNMGLRILGSTLANFSSTATSISDPSAFLPSNITRVIDSIVSDYYQLAYSTISAIPASSPGQTHRACYAFKLQEAAYRYNFSRLLSDSNNLICSTTTMLQEYGLFSTKPADECFYALKDDFAQSSSDSTIMFDIRNVTQQHYQYNDTITSVDRFGKFKMTAFPRISNSTTTTAQLNSTSLLSYNISGYDSMQSSFSWKFNTSLTFDTSLLLTQSQTRDYQLAQWGQMALQDRFVALEGVQKPLNSSHNRDTLPACNPGYYAVFDDATSEYICTTCPIGSYCLGPDGLQRLCSNGPMGRSVYTTPSWATSACPFNCTALGECLSGSTCAVPSTGSMCAQGKAVACPAASASPLWSYSSSCTASLQNLAYFHLATDSSSCSAYKWCKFASKPTSNFALFFTLLTAERPSNTTMDLFYSPNQYKVSLSLTTSLQAQLSLQLLTSFGTVSISATSQPFLVTIGKAIDLSLITSDTNYLMMFANDSPIYYSFFDASSPVASNNGYILTAPYSTTAPLISISNIIFTASNETIYAQNLRETPFGLRSLFCDLSSSSLDASGKCLSPCPSGRVRTTLSGDISICTCSSTSDCFDRSYSSSTSCNSGTYFSWSGSYFLVEVVSGYGFMSSLSYVEAGGSQTTFPFCSQIQPNQNLNCRTAISDTNYQGWSLSPGTEAVFYLAATSSKRSSFSHSSPSTTSSRSSDINTLTRDNQAITAQIARFLFKIRSLGLGNTISLNLYFSSSAAQILSKSTSTLIAQNWNVDMIPLDTLLSDEWLETLDPSKATWLAKTSPTSTFSPSWTAQSTCLTCPSSSFLSLPPLLTVRDCICSNGVVPDLAMGCQVRPSPSERSLLSSASAATVSADDASCQTLIESVSPILLSGSYPTATSTGFTSSIRNFTQGFNSSIASPWDGPLYVDLSIAVEGQSSLQSVSLLVGESIPLMISNNMTYRVNVPGCTPSDKAALLYEVLPRCSTPTINVGGNAQQTLVAIFGASNTNLYFFADAPSNIIDEANIPWVAYYTPFEVTKTSIIYSRAVSIDGTCYVSSVVTYNIYFEVPSTDSPTPISGSSSQCDRKCVIVIAVSSTIAVVALLVTGLLIIIFFPLRRKGT